MSGYTGRLNQRVQLKNLLTFQNRLPVVTPLTNVYLRAYLGQPKTFVGAGTDNSPRERAPYHLYFALRTVGVNATIPTPGSIVSYKGVDYEVIGSPRDLVANRSVYGYVMRVLPTNILYPNIGKVGGVGGPVDIGPEVSFSVWPGTQTPAGRGVYDDMVGEAPASAWELLRVTNASLTVGDDVYKVTSALLDLEQPHVALRLRRRDS